MCLFFLLVDVTRIRCFVDAQKDDQLNSIAFNKNKYADSSSGEKLKKKGEGKQQSVIDKYSLIPEDFKYENKHYKYIKYTKNDMVKSYKVSLTLFVFCHIRAIIEDLVIRRT